MNGVSLPAGLSIEAVVQGSLFVVLTILGLAIIAIAVQGYRRNRSRPMLFLALGFAGIVVPELLVAAVTQFVTELSQFWIVTFFQVTNVFAFICILYAITMEP